MEYIPYPTLQHEVNKRGPLPESEALLIFQQVVDAVYHMHSVGVAHRDLKCDNVLVDPVSKHTVVVDFGLSATLRTTNDTSTSYVGTPSNMAPELLSRMSYHPVQVDAYAAGIMLLEMLLGRHPFASAESENDILRMQIQRWDFSCFSPTVANILHGLLQPHSSNRWTLGDVLRALNTESPL